MSDEDLKIIIEALREKSASIDKLAGELQDGRQPDLLSAGRLLERSLFHLDRAASGSPRSTPILAEEGEMLDIEIEEDLLEANRQIAELNREAFAENGVKTVDVMGAIGSGKTSLIGAMVERLSGQASVGMLGGDVATSIDADRVRRHGAVTLQINTGKECHLDANLVRRALDQMDLGKLDILFIENVGNLICPSEFDLGCEKKLVVVSVTEGDSMVVKHPLMFVEADVVAINKIDMAEVFGTDAGKIESDLESLNPRAVPIRTSVRTGEGIEELLGALSLP
ncbi:MAG: hydrogenase nickel incorporation protein HypB [Theionarchaea archaeon]|nr:hydrogenase nickel incorporation protein HypB [Theionarchaea archaeon]